MKLGELAVYLTGNTGDFESKMKAAQRTLAGTAASFIKLGAGALTIGSAFEFARRQTVDYLRDVNELRNLSRLTGMDIGDIDNLADAAKAADVNTQDLVTSVRMMQKSLGQTEIPLAYRKALADIGVTIDSIKGKNPAEQFKKIASALAEITDPTEKTSLAMQLFGKGGSSILPMLADGKEGLNEFMEAADKWGFNMSEASKRTALQVNKDIKEMGFAWEGLKMKLTEGIFIPILGGGWAVATMGEKAEKAGVTEGVGSSRLDSIANFAASYVGGFFGAEDVDQWFGGGATRWTDSVDAQQVEEASIKRKQMEEDKIAQDQRIADAKAEIEQEKNAASFEKKFADYGQQQHEKYLRQQKDDIMQAEYAARRLKTAFHPRWKRGASRHTPQSPRAAEARCRRK
jgi:hypothetical protein